MGISVVKRLRLRRGLKTPHPSGPPQSFSREFRPGQVPVPTELNGKVFGFQSLWPLELWTGERGPSNHTERIMDKDQCVLCLGWESTDLWPSAGVTPDFCRQWASFALTVLCTCHVGFATWAGPTETFSLPPAYDLLGKIGFKFSSAT